MKIRQKCLVTSISALSVVLLALASAPAGAVVSPSAGYCKNIANCVAFCETDVCSVVSCKTKCLKGYCNGDDAFVCY